MSMFLEHTNNSNSSMIYFIYTRSLLLFYVPEVLREDPRLPIRFAHYVLVLRFILCAVLPGILL